tara:strand:- start:682 stop:3819 length:3138 start_codon:yes stop_codon:yes gene_type:complete
MSNNSSLTANSLQGLGLNDTLTSILAAQETSRILASVDYSDFSNFIFFNSAERKVQTSLTFILDNWPIGRTDGIYGSDDFIYADSASDQIDAFVVSATDYDLHLINKLSDPNETGRATVTASLTANLNKSSSALRTVVDIPRNTDMLLTNSDQITFVDNLLLNADVYDLGRNSTSLQGGTATISSIGTQVFPSSTSSTVNREFQLKNLLPAILFENDETLVLERYVTVMAEVLDNLKIYIDNFLSLRSVEYNLPTIANGNLQIAAAELMGFKLINENLRQDLTQQLLRSSSSGSVPVNDIVEQLHGRIVNNLIHILKTKGTKDSIESLIKSFGIPSGFLNVREYATQVKAEPTTYNNRKDYYVLDYTNNSVTGDRLASYLGKPVSFNFLIASNGEATIETRIKFPSLTADTLTSTFLSMTDKVLNYKIKLFYNDGQIIADYTKLQNILGSTSGTLTVKSPEGLSASLKQALSSGFTNVALRINSDNIKLDVLYPDTIEGKNTITSITGAVSNTLTASTDALLRFGSEVSTIVLGGEINSFGARPRANDVTNLFNGQMQEVRLWQTYVHNDDLTAHTSNFESITLQKTQALNRSNLTSTLIGLSNPYESLKYHFKLRENIKSGSIESGVNSANNYADVAQSTSSEALSVLSTTASQDLYSKISLSDERPMVNDGGLLFNVTRSSVSGEYNTNSFEDSRLLSIVADPIEIINQNILNTYDQLSVGALYGTATALYDSMEYKDVGTYVQNWYNSWPDSNVSNSIMFKGIKDYQIALENLQDVLHSVLLTTEQLIPARSHLAEKGLLVKSHLLNRSKQERLKDSITSLDILGNRSTQKNSITAADDGLIHNAISFNDTPASYNTQARDYSLTKPNVTALSRVGVQAREHTSIFQTVIHPIEFLPTYPDKTKVDAVFDRVLVSPTGSNSVVQCSVRLLSNSKRIRTTKNAIKIIFPTFADQSQGLLGVSKLIISIDEVIMPRALSEYEFPVSNEDGVVLIIRPTPEFQKQILNLVPDENEPAPIFDVNLVFINLITQEKTIQPISYSLAY